MRFPRGPQVPYYQHLSGVLYGTLWLTGKGGCSKIILLAAVKCWLHDMGKWCDFLSRLEDRDTPKDLSYSRREQHAEEVLTAFCERFVREQRKLGVVAKGKPTRLQVTCRD